MSEAPAVHVKKAELAVFARALLEAAGAPAGAAHVVIDHLLEADAMGLKSHGIMRVPQYIDDIDAGGILPAATPSVTRPMPGRAAFDGGKGFGQVVGMAMAAEAGRLARETGVAFVTGRRMGHTGRIGAYPEAIARDGCLGIVVCSGPRAGHWVAPFGGLAGRLATNPIAYAYPVAGAEPVVADFSTSVVPEGVIRSLMNRGLPAPEGAIREPDGTPTTDPRAIYGTPRGAIQPLGGAFGYRGTALGILVDVLAALLADDDADDPNREGSNLAMLAISVDGGFSKRSAQMADYLRSSPAIDPARPVMMPGEREQREVARSGDRPVLVDGPTWAAMAARVGGRIVMPRTVSD